MYLCASPWKPREIRLRLGTEFNLSAMFHFLFLIEIESKFTFKVLKFVKLRIYPGLLVMLSILSALQYF